MEAKVKVLLFATLRDKYGVRELEVVCDGSLEDLVRKLTERLGESFREEIVDDNNDLRRDRIIFINGRHIQFIDEVSFKDGDVIAIFPPVAGG